ncbi:hypothetical protein SAY86_016836 [Trapa natans]|uniref:AP2/ERF domain-containing protein n=1 Tax=Trapa natans TaxID=22666 RepID=A0AAN7M0G2_TRANT|nr:hypothetical protein SAY86_016836 [Trapa natans]
MTAVVGEWMMADKEEQAVAAMSLACTVISPHDDGGEAEAPDSNSSTLPHNPGKRRTKVSSSSSSSSSRFKGVVPQQNGNWGAQIYANHQRIWLGTFKSEEEAAMAYDSAAIKLRSGDPHRNIPWTLDESMAEHNFQSLFSQEAVLSMIKDGSYRSKFANYIRVVESERHNKVARLNTDFVQQKEDVFRNVNRPDQQHLIDWGSGGIGSGGIASRFHCGGDQRGVGEEAAQLDECDKDTDTNSYNTKLGVKIFGVQFN